MRWCRSTPSPRVSAPPSAVGALYPVGGVEGRLGRGKIKPRSRPRGPRASAANRIVAEGLRMTDKKELPSAARRVLALVTWGGVTGRFMRKATVLIALALLVLPGFAQSRNCLRLMSADE